MKIAITGTSSGVGQALVTLLKTDHNIVELTRQHIDLGNSQSLINKHLDFCDMLINCAGTDIGGKTQFDQHELTDIDCILSVNLLAPIYLTHKVLQQNPFCKIVNITSTNNNRYWANDLAYSLSKKALEEFGNMLRVEYPGINLLEVKLGLTKTNFNKSRYARRPNQFVDIYTQPHLTPPEVATKIITVLFDPAVKSIEISP
jgi:3-hydroxy acid dehydrogenase/malonic semialdehyde reductase